MVISMDFKNFGEKLRKQDLKVSKYFVMYSQSLFPFEQQLLFRSDFSREGPTTML